MINFVRLWVTNYFYDFEDDPLALDQIKSFMQFVSFSGLEKQAEPITAAIARKVPTFLLSDLLLISSNESVSFSIV